MKVLIVCSGNSPDGSRFYFHINQAFIYEQVKCLQHEKVEFELFFVEGKGIVSYLLNWYKLLQHLRKNSYALIHAHNGLSGLIATLQPFVKTIITFHGSDINQKKTRFLSNIACLLADYRIFVSHKLFNKLYVKPSGRYAIIPCGIDINNFFYVPQKFARQQLNLDEEKSYILFSSYFDNPLKNIQLARDAVELVPGVEILELKNRTREEVNLLLNAVDLLIMTSLSEGSPQVIKEAMACNCPIITTDVGDVHELIGTTKNCFICQSNPVEIAEKIRYLLGAKVRTEGRRSILSYDNRLIAKKILNIYRYYGVTGSYQRCAKGLWDTTIPGITFDENGVSNYCRIQEKLMDTIVRGEEGLNYWKRIEQRIRENGKGKRYDCIIGVSGGTDSSYLMHIAVNNGLRPLALNLDNGWNSDVSVKNIRKVTNSLNIDLETYVIDYEEVKDVLRSQMKAGLPWIDAPTDYAIMSQLYRTAKREGIKFILMGTDFRSEGKQPTEWTYTDKRLIKDVHRRYGKLKLKTYPLIYRLEILFFGYFRNIKIIEPLNYIGYNKGNAQKILKQLYDWEYYGGHHHENLFTKFTIGYWLPLKFNIDKRLVTLSAQILSGGITREQALKELEKPAIEAENHNEILNYVIKKLDFSEEEFTAIWQSPVKSFTDYKSNYKTIRRLVKLMIPIASLILPQKPKIFYEIEGRTL